jgi:hypothetical protein
LTTRCSNPGRRRNFYLRLKVHTESGDRPSSCLMGTADSFPGVKRTNHEVKHVVHLVSRLRMSGFMPLVAVYSCTFRSSFNAIRQQLQAILGILVLQFPNTVRRCQRDLKSANKRNARNTLIYSSSFRFMEILPCN